MLRQILKLVIRKELVSHPLRCASARQKGFDVKINEENASFELHDEEVDVSSGKQKKFEFPFVYLRDNCQVGLPFTASSLKRQIK